MVLKQNTRQSETFSIYDYDKCIARTYNLMNNELDSVDLELIRNYDLVEKLGYGRGKHVGKSGDKGIDGEVPQDKLGLDTIYLQAKRHSDNISAHDVRDFIGALSLKKSRKGIFITTSNFSKEAYEDIAKSEKNIVLINGEQLVRYMIENNIGIKVKKTIKIKEIDEEYFE